MKRFKVFCNQREGKPMAGEPIARDLTWNQARTQKAACRRAWPTGWHVIVEEKCYA